MHPRDFPLYGFFFIPQSERRTTRACAGDTFYNPLYIVFAPTGRKNDIQRTFARRSDVTDSVSFLSLTEAKTIYIEKKYHAATGEGVISESPNTNEATYTMLPQAKVTFVEVYVHKI